MARWISQAECPSITPASRRRTAYLAPIADRVREVVRDYLTENPRAEDVTLAVLSRVEGPLRAFRAARSSTRLNQDVGLLVAQTLVDEYTSHRVWTLRAEDGRSVSTRRNTRPDLQGVERFTPHRVDREDRRRADRILLDTIVVSNFLHENEHALDVKALKAHAGDHRISLADGSLAELARALSSRRLPVNLWARRIPLLDGLLDPDLPVAPGGFELAAWLGLRPLRGVDMEGMGAYYRGVWRYLTSRRTAADLARPGYYEDAGGRRFEVRLDAEHIDAVFDDAGRKWARWVEDAASELTRLRREGDDLSDVEKLRQLTRTFLGMDMTTVGLDRIDLAIRVIASRTREAAVNGYRPTKPNDALDFDLLFAVAMPAVICTHDERLIQLAQRTGSSDAWRVMSPPGLIDWLMKEQQEPSPGEAPEATEEEEGELGPEAQEEAWNGWAERGPDGPIHDGAVGWP